MRAGPEVWNLTEPLRVYIGVIWNSFWDNGKVRVHIGVKYGLYWGYIGIMEKKMETTIGLYGRENGNHYIVWCLWRLRTLQMT